jgi:hypothetical protein
MTMLVVAWIAILHSYVCLHHISSCHWSVLMSLPWQIYCGNCGHCPITHYFSIILMLIMYTRHELQLEVIMVGVTWCPAVVKCQVKYKVQNSCFVCVCVRAHMRLCISLSNAKWCKCELTFSQFHYCYKISELWLFQSRPHAVSCLHIY